ncbi:DUF4394 domain-containing protein [Hymenobacter psoromatis]|uniref:DUF4394 domain-containing protein n=1 Tax=Hymenobacter psoromatis TaxID=1484116 RepID=UPI001CBAA28C|nr:DUF4394 domain-containing protein [Hymenobacter psoromatis]
MQNFFPTQSLLKSLRPVAVALGVLAAPAAFAQAPTSVYALGNNSSSVAYLGVPAGAQTLTQFNPSSFTVADLANNTKVITGIMAGQQLVGIDVRPNTGQLYALGYNSSATTANAQLYTLDYGTAVLTAVGPALTLNLADDNRANTRGYVPNVGFDFNPRVDRIRVVAPNRTDYRLNPNTGALTAEDGQLTYVAGNNVGHDPYIGTAAYTNAAPGVSGTTLYDLDLTANNALLSTQNPPNAGTLNPQAPVTFQTNTDPQYFPLTSPTVNAGLDIYYDHTGRQNLAYLLVARFSDPKNTDVSQGFASNFYSLNLTTGQASGMNLFGKSPLFFSDIAVGVNAPKVWNGSVNTAWSNAANWTPTGVPAATDDVFIPGPSATILYQPTVGDAEQAFSVTLGAGAVLNTQNGGMLSLGGNFVNNDGTVTGDGNGTVAFVGTATQEISGPNQTNFRNLTINNTGGVTTSSAVSVERALTVSSDLTIGTGLDFILSSNSTTGVAYVVNSGGVVNGTATVRRYITPTNSGLGYRHYSAPVTNTTVGDLATSSFTPIFNAAYNTSPTPGTTTPFPTVFGYSQAQYEGSPATTITLDFDKGFYSPAGGSDAWPSGTGFTANLGASELVDFVGTLANGAISTVGQGRSTKANAGWQLLGNPYPSSLDWDQVTATGLANIAPSLYVYKSSGQYTGSYASYVNGQGTNGGTNVVPVAQGFLVRTAAAGATGNINFANSQRITTDATAPFQRTAADTRPQLLLELSNGPLASQTDIYFESGATAGLDNAFDAPALPFPNGLVLASEAGADVLAINGQPALSGAAVTVPLRLAVATAGSYALRVATLANLPAGYHAYLRDATQNTYTDLATTPSVSLNLASGAATGRFAVLFTSASPLATAPATLAALASVFPSPAQGTATLVLPQALRGTAPSTVQLLNTLGQVVLTRTLAAGGPDNIELPLTGLATGIYTVRATTAAGQVAKRLVVQ